MLDGGSGSTMLIEFLHDGLAKSIHQRRLPYRPVMVHLNDSMSSGGV